MTKIKICGIKRYEDVEYVNRLEPDFVGFLLWKKSKRYVTPEQAAALKAKLKPGIKAVGVFVNESIEKIVSLAEAGTIDLVQLHGDEEPQFIKALRQRITVPIIKAVRVKDAGSFKGLEVYPVDYFLFDTYKPGAYGGTGESFNFTLSKEICVDKPYFIAGGLDQSNVGALLKHSDVYAVDVSGGVETDGVKDENKIRAFIEAVRSGSNE